jgi:hypothetical protein
MNKDEETGLRAFTLTVGSVAATEPAQPLWVECAGVRIAVAAIDADWLEEERLGFRVRLADDTTWLLYYVPELDLWSGIAAAGAVGGATTAVSAGSDHPQAGQP